MLLAALVPVLLPASAEAPPEAPHLKALYWKQQGCKHGHTRKYARRGIRKAVMAGKPVRHFVRCTFSAESTRLLRRYLHRYRRRATPRGYARWLLRRQPGQFSCLDSLVWRESRWNVYATNSSSGAYGIPQALPGSKMASAGADWRTNGRTQIRWMLGYTRGRYGTPCGALAHSHSVGWY